MNNDKEFIKNLQFENQHIDLHKPAIITIMAKNDVGKSIFTMLGGIPDKTLYIVTDSSCLTSSLSPFQDIIPNVTFLKNIDHLTEIASKFHLIKQQIIVFDHIGALITRAKAEFSCPPSDTQFYYKLGAWTSKKISTPLSEIILKSRQHGKILVFLCPLTYLTTDDLTEGDVAFDTKVAQEVIFNEADLIIYLRRKKVVNNLSDFFKNIEIITSLPNSIFPLKDKGLFRRREVNKKLHNTFSEILAQINA